jgi:hypothetical protein
MPSGSAPRQIPLENPARQNTINAAGMRCIGFPFQTG